MTPNVDNDSASSLSKVVADAVFFTASIKNSVSFVNSLYKSLLKCNLGNFVYLIQGQIKYTYIVEI